MQAMPTNAEIAFWIICSVAAIIVLKLLFILYMD